MANSFREKLKKGTVLMDGAFGTYAAERGLNGGHYGGHPGCIEYVALASPDFIAEIHRDYLEAGADAVETNTFGGSAVKLAEYGLADSVYEVNLEATRLARAAADAFSTASVPRYVIGTMGPTGKLPSSTDPELGDISFVELRDVYAAQGRAIIDGGADALLVETGQDLLEMKAAVRGAALAAAEKRKDIVIMAHCTLANNGRMLLGTEVSAVMAVLPYLGAEVIGLNCSTGPLEMEGQLAALSEGCPVRVSCVPNAGLPFEENGKTIYPLGPIEMADVMRGFLEKYRIDVLGGCCGTTPEHIRQMREVIIGNKKHGSSGKKFYASFYRGFDLAKSERPIRVGERINTQGSRKMKDMLSAEDYDGIIELGKAQQSAGADLLDVCCVLTERPTEKRDMVVIGSRLAESVQVPLMIDSTDTDVVEAALEAYPGTAFINSVNLEDGGEKARNVFALAKEHGSFVVALTIDEKGMAATVERKLEIAGRLYRIAVEEYGIEPHRLLFDTLTFTLATGEAEYAESAIRTCEAIKLLKEKLPGVLAVLGVSNVSFGLGRRCRKTLNMVFLHHAVLAGLDAAIVNPAEYLKYEDIPEDDRGKAEDLLFNRHPDALTRFIGHFEGKDQVKKGAAPPAVDVSIEQKIKNCVFDRNKTGIIALVDEALKTRSAEDLVNSVLMDAMKEVGEKLDSGKMVLPYVLQSAEVMKKAIDHLEGSLSGPAAGKRGKVILATVFGDVHDIGKNLVKMVLKNNGFDVIDLGKQVPVEKIVEEAQKNNVDAVGLSALLVSTARHMKTCVQAMHDAGLEYPLIIGGAPVNKRFAKEISALGEEDVYKGGVFYARDAFTGLRIIQALTNRAEKKETMDEYFGQFAEGDASFAKAAAAPRARAKAPKPLPRADVPVPTFYGIRAVSNISVDEVFLYLDERAVFEHAWGASKIRSAEEKERLFREEYRPLLDGLKEEAVRKGWLDLKAVYGYFRCRACGDTMEVRGEDGEVIETIGFPRGDAGRSIVDYFPGGEDGIDVTAFQAVTVGKKINSAIESLTVKEEVTRAYLLHGMSVHLAEALAAYLHDRIRGELGLKEGQGRRYSPGYPLWRNLEDQKKIFRLLEIERRIGLRLTEGYLIVPEQSTTAMIVHNDRAEY